MKNWRKPSYRLWWFMRTYLEIVKPMNLPRGSRILSVGIGMGHVEQFLANPFGYDVTGIDFSSSSLEIANSLFGSKINTVLADALSLPFRKGAFDGVVSIDFMEHLPNLSSAKTALGEMDRVLKDDCSMLHKITVLGEDGMDADRTHHIKQSADVWRDWFNANGWKTYRALNHRVPIWQRRKLGFYPVKGAFYIRKQSK
ncbi:class I SAM-dependent methyltransferase [Patescibacteria group bacterium]|nr:class I SAM-dependent methyltransferase [Patescibacteria group bacterium]